MNQVRCVYLRVCEGEYSDDSCFVCEWEEVEKMIQKVDGSVCEPVGDPVAHAAGDVGGLF